MGHGRRHDLDRRLSLPAAGGGRDAGPEGRRRDPDWIPCGPPGAARAGALRGGKSGPHRAHAKRRTRVGLIQRADQHGPAGLACHVTDGISGRSGPRSVQAGPRPRHHSGRRRGFRRRARGSAECLRPGLFPRQPDRAIMSSPGQTPRGVLITGTDTGVGKTIVTAAVVTALTANGFNTRLIKPIATGTSPGADALSDPDWLASVTGVNDPPDLIAPYRLRTAASPLIAAAREGLAIEPARIIG